MNGIIQCRAGSLRAAVIAASSLAVACRAIVPLQPSTRFGDRPALEQDLVLPEPCTLLPGATPMGRPDGVRAHTLPAARYRPQLEDHDGIYFASPDGICVTEPAPRGQRTLPGGVYVAHDHHLAWEYLGDATGIHTRQPLPDSCPFRIEPRSNAPSPHR